MTARTRRSVLSGAAAGAAVAATAGLAASPAEAAAPGRRVTVTVVGLRRLDPPPTAPPTPGHHPLPVVGRPRAGDRCVATGVVTAVVDASGVGSGGSHYGAFLSDVVTLVDAGQAPQHGTAVSYEQHLLTLPGGTLAGTGTTDRHGRGVFAVVGGTGAYVGAKGSYTAQLHRLDLGGDGSARLDLSLDQ